MGEGEDGIKKTPEWAAPICAVPADTIREFARLYGTEKPVHLQYFYSCAKRHMGDYTAAASMLFAGHDRQHRLPRRLRVGRLSAHAGPCPGPLADFGRNPGDYQVPGVQQQLPHRDPGAPERLLGRPHERERVPPSHRQPHQRRAAAEHSDDHLREQLRQQPLQREQALRRYGEHRVQLGLPVAHEPAHRGVVRHHPAGARVAVRGHGRVHVRPPALRERPQRHAQLLHVLRPRPGLPGRGALQGMGVDRDRQAPRRRGGGRATTRA